MVEFTAIQGFKISGITCLPKAVRERMTTGIVILLLLKDLQSLHKLRLEILRYILPVILNLRMPDSMQFNRQLIFLVGVLLRSKLPQMLGMQ